MKLSFRSYMIIGCIALLSIIGLSIYRNAAYGTLDLTIVPSGSIIKTADGKTLKSGSKLKAGTYKLDISRQYFADKVISVTIVGGKKYSQTIALLANSAQGRQWWIDHPNESAIADGVGSRDVNATAQANAKTYPILPALPTFAQIPYFWRLDYGKSAKYPNDASKVALYLTADGQPAQQAALQWMKDHGYDPAKYEIIYQSVATYTQQVNAPQTLDGE